MASPDQITNWIRRTRDVIDPSNPPKLNATDKLLAAPWLSDATLEVYTQCADDPDSLQALTDACEQAMLAAGDDVSTRFFVLHLYYWVRRFAEPDEPWDEDANEAYGRVTDAFGHLVSLSSVDACPRAWPLIRWEITNAYAAGQWKRAVDLFNLAEKVSLVPARDARLMRGQFQYQLAAEMPPYDPLRDVTWEPRVLGSKGGFTPPQLYPSDSFSDQLAQATLFARAVERTGTGVLDGIEMPSPPPANTLDSYRDARNDLEKALSITGDKVCPVYEAILARCCFEVGDFANAARYYGALLKGTIHFGPEHGDSRKVRPQIYLQVARSHRAAFQATEAADMLLRGLREYPNDHPLLLEQAGLAEQETDFVQAFRSLKAATETVPEAERDLGTRLAIVLGDAFVSSKEVGVAIDSALKRNPEVADLITEILRVSWPAFSLLSDGARDRWLVGLHHMIITSRLEARLRMPFLEEAVGAFAKAVERELRDRVFKPAKVALEGQAQARARGHFDPLQPEYRFVLFAAGNEKKLTLGEMRGVLAATRKSREGLSAELRAWIVARVPRWEELVGLLDVIVPARNLVAHGDDGVQLSAPQVHGHCQRALEILVSQAR